MEQQNAMAPAEAFNEVARVARSVPMSGDNHDRLKVCLNVLAQAIQPPVADKKPLDKTISNPEKK